MCALSVLFRITVAVLIATNVQGKGVIRESMNKTMQECFDKYLKPICMVHDGGIACYKELLKIAQGEEETYQINVFLNSTREDKEIQCPAHVWEGTQNCYEKYMQTFYRDFNKWLVTQQSKQFCRSMSAKLGALNNLKKDCPMREISILEKIYMIQEHQSDICHKDTLSSCTEKDSEYCYHSVQLDMQPHPCYSKPVNSFDTLASLARKCLSKEKKCEDKDFKFTKEIIGKLRCP